MRLKIRAGVTSINRYIAAVDGGEPAISTSHTPPWRSRRMCISVTTRSTTHQPFRSKFPLSYLHAGEQNNVDGRFLPDLAGEIAAWFPGQEEFSSTAL